MTAAGFTPGEPFRMVVEEGKVHEFARATGSEAPEHLRAVDPVSPPTFLASHRLWMAAPNSGWHGTTRDFRYVLHGEESFTFHGAPPAAGTVLTVQQSIERQYEKQGRRGGTMVFTDLVTRFWTDGGSAAAPLVEERTVTITTEPPAEGSAEPTANPPVAAPAPLPDGDVLFDVTRPALTVTDFVRYQGASGDFNPIHHDTAFAQASGQPGPFAVGMLPAAVAANLLHAAAGIPPHVRIRWSDKAWPGDALRYRGIRVDDGSTRVDVVRPNGRPHVTVWGGVPA